MAAPEKLLRLEEGMGRVLSESLRLVEGVERVLEESKRLEDVA